MAAHKGHKKAGGRKKGTPNKLTVSVKGAFKEAFDELGGVAALVQWGKKYPTHFYGLYSKLIPQEIEHSGPGGGPIETLNIVRNAAELSDDELRLRLQKLETGGAVMGRSGGGAAKTEGQQEPGATSEEQR
jgi:hypothetical protein